MQAEILPGEIIIAERDQDLIADLASLDAIDPAGACQDSLVYPELSVLSAHAGESFHFAERRARQT